MHASQLYGMGVSGSPLICGGTDHHRRLEHALVELHQKEACVVMAVGFGVNTSFFGRARSCRNPKHEVE